MVRFYPFKAAVIIASSLKSRQIDPQVHGIWNYAVKPNASTAARDFSNQARTAFHHFRDLSLRVAKFFAPGTNNLSKVCRAHNAIAAATRIGTFAVFGLRLDLGSLLKTASVYTRHLLFGSSWTLRR